MEPFYPLHVYVCERCFLVQLEEYVSPEEIFTEYAYFSSYADSWLRHAKDYTDLMVERFGIGPDSLVVELASNDGYLLQYFVEKGIPVLGIEPARNVAKVAIEKGIPTLVEFFGEKTAERLVCRGKAGRPDHREQRAGPGARHSTISSRGMKILLKPKGVITMEFPHLVRLMEENQFDTIYHEHFSYFSFIAVEKIFAAHGLTLFDVEELPTHGGSLRIYARHAEDETQPVERRVRTLSETSEEAADLRQMRTYAAFSEKVKETKRKLLEFLIQRQAGGKDDLRLRRARQGEHPAELLRHPDRFPRLHRRPESVQAGEVHSREPISRSFLPTGSGKRGRITSSSCPGTSRTRSSSRCRYIRDWGGKFIVPIPEVKVYRMIFQRDGPEGRLRHRDREARGRARLLRPVLVPEGVRGPRPESAARAVQHLLQRQEGDPAGDALPGHTVRGSEARPVHAGSDLRRDRRPPAGFPELSKSTSASS